MNLSERVCNWLLGLSALGWSVKAIVGVEAETRFTAVPITLCALNALVGVLFLLRAPLQVASRPFFLAAALPSFLLGGLLMRLAQPQPWPIYSQGMFAGGGLLAFVSLAYLGRSFALLPGVRTLVARGPYRLVRHPAYAGECVMLLAACLAGLTAATIAVAVAAFVLLVVRILVEEATLLEDAEYRAYAHSHRWRLVPGVW